jgi:hypothetical protein
MARLFDAIWIPFCFLVISSAYCQTSYSFDADGKNLLEQIQHLRGNYVSSYIWQPIQSYLNENPTFIWVNI